MVNEEAHSNGDNDVDNLENGIDEELGFCVFDADLVQDCMDIVTRNSSTRLSESTGWTTYLARPFPDH